MHAADDLVGVGHDAGNDAAGFVVGELGEGKLGEVLVEAEAQRAGHAVVDALHGEEFKPVEGNRDDRGGDQEDDDRHERLIGGGRHEGLEPRASGRGTGID